MKGRVQRVNVNRELLVYRDIDWTGVYYVTFICRENTKLATNLEHGLKRMI